MKNYMSVACLALMALLHICSGQRTVFGLLSGSNTLIKFNSANPGSIMATVPISGLTGDAVGMDFRPFNGALYVLTTGGGVYTVNTQTGVATLSTTLAGCTIAAGTVYSIDFNPTVDLLRIISSGGANFRANVVNGTCLTDGTINVPNSGPLPSIFGVAYTNSFRGAGSTVLYALDASTLGTVTDPNAGAYEFTRNTSFTTVAPVGFDSVPATVVNGGDQLLWASLTVNGVTGLYAISTSGAATAVGTIGTGAALRAIAISLTPIAVTAYAVTTANQLVRIDTEDSSSVIPVTVTGLAAGDIMLGVDFRLSDQRLYAVTAGTAGSRVYVINVLTYVATQVGANLNGCTFSTVTTVFFGVDWNPRVNQLRVVDSTGNNFRINVETSTCVVEGNINLSGGGTAPVISAVAYTNNTAAFVNTTLRAFDLGAVPPTFGTLSPPALGEYTASGPLTVAVPTSGPASFDIFGTDNTGLATVVIDTVSYLVTVNTGDGTLGFIAQPGAVNIKSLSVSFFRVPMTPSPTGFYPTAVVLTATAPQQAISVSTSAVGTVITSAPITNLTAGTTLLGMDLRPSNQRVVGISSDSKIYIIDLTTAIAYQVTTLSCTLPTTAGIVYALDFNPVADLLRIVSSTGANYRVNVDNGTCIIDGNLQYTDNTTPQAVGVAYTNSTAGATGTQEYILDQNNNGFAQVTNPNGGATSLRGTVGINIFPNPPTVDVAGSTPLDILTVNSVQWAFAVIANTLYDVNIATGSLRTYGYITTPSPIIGLTILPEGYVPPAPPVINATTATSTTTTTSTGTTTGTSTGTGTGTTGTAPTAGAGASSTTSSASSVLISFFVIALVLAIHF